MTTDGAAALDALYWRDEILKALFWMRGEGLADAVEPADLARFLAVDEATVVKELQRLAADGYLQVRPAWHPAVTYGLTPLGMEEGGRGFKDEFEGLTRQAHGECAPGCTCQDPEHQGEPCPSREPVNARP